MSTAQNSLQPQILHVIADFTELGGAEAMLIRLVNATADSYNHHIISLMGCNEPMKGRLDSRVKVTSFGAKSVLGILLTAFKLSRHLKYSAYHCVYSWMYHANLICALAKRLSGTKRHLIWSVHHSLDNIAGETFKIKISIWLGRLFNTQANRAIYCSQKALLQHTRMGYSRAADAVYIPNGYDFSPETYRDFTNPNFVIGAAGRFHPAKNYPMFFAVVSKLKQRYPKLRFAVVGRGIDTNNAELMQSMAQVDLTSNDVELLGPVDDMSAFYQRIDFFLLTSVTEGFPNVLPEASSMGCICFTTDVGDAALIVEDKTRVAARCDVDDMVQKISHYIEMPPEALSALSTSAMERVRANYDISAVATMYMSLAVADD